VKIAVFDDFVPHVDLGAGLPRANALVNELAQRCERVAYTAMEGGTESPDQWYRDIDSRVAIRISHRHADYTAPLEALAAEGFDVLWVSRPPNMERIGAALARRPDLREAFTVVYDAEALYAPRTVQYNELAGIVMPAQARAAMLEREYATARGADLIVSVTQAEATALEAGAGRRVFVLGFTTLVDATPAAFGERRDLGFVGPLRGASPNEDSLLWYGANVLHAVAARTQAKLRVVGAAESPTFLIYAGPECEILGPRDDLRAFFNEIRIFIAPTRFAAGLPQKLIDAASAGVPIVGTALLAGQLGWSHRREMLIADTADAFANACVELYTNEALWSALRANAAQRILERYGPGCFARELDAIVAAIRDRPPRYTEPART